MNSYDRHTLTARDLERMEEPSASEIAVYAAVLVLGMACALLFAFTI